MGAVLTNITDPRDALSKAKRIELWQFAKRNSVVEIAPTMPANLMRSILRKKGLTHIEIPRRTLGQIGAFDDRVAAAQQPQTATPAPDQKVAEVDVMDDLARQYGEMTRPDPYDAMGVTECRKECKRLGIKQGRGEKPESLRAKLKAHRNGKDAS